jgi:hypothetical protein
MTTTKATTTTTTTTTTIIIIIINRVQKCPIGHFGEGIKVPYGTFVTHYWHNCALLIGCKSAL